MAISLETLRNNIQTSIFGRRLGLTNDGDLVGPRDIRVAVEDIGTTVATTVLAYGVTRITTMGSSQGPTQHNLPAPVPGLRKMIVMHSTSTGSQQFLSTPNGASVIATSVGTTTNCVNFRGPGGSIELVGVSTSVWQVVSGQFFSSTALADCVTFTTSTA